MCVVCASRVCVVCCVLWGVGCGGGVCACVWFVQAVCVWCVVCCVLCVCKPCVCGVLCVCLCV